MLDLARDALTTLILKWGEPAFRAQQLWTAVHKNHIHSAEEITTFSRELRARAEEELEFKPLTSVNELLSSDGSTRKTLFGLTDGCEIESVLMLYHQRRTVCVSTQVGCALGCSFCATGQMGFQRNLSRGEIAAQVYAFSRDLSALNEQVTNVVLMGMGEPFHNYDESIASLNLLNHPDGMNLGARRMTISTVGLVPEIRRYTQENHPYKLAVSLHASTDELRSQILPVNRTFPLSQLLSACRDYVEHSGRRITFEWALIEGINDTDEQLEGLIELCKDLLCHVNLIPLNPSADTTFRSTSHRRAELFIATLQERGISCSLRLRRGLDIQAGCGQLAVQNTSK